MERQLTKREQLIERILRLPDEQVEAIAVFLEKLPATESEKRTARTAAGIVSVPVRKVMALRGLVHVGGDALEDTKRLYD